MASEHAEKAIKKYNIDQTKAFPTKLQCLMAEKKLLVPNIGDFKNVEVIEVLVKSGQQIKKNDPLITLESDKSSVEVPATDEGKINKIIVKVGDKVSEGSEILSLDSVSKKEESKKIVEEKEKIPEKKIATETPKK